MVDTILSLTKARLGIKSDVRDVYITSIINGVLDELQNVQGITILEERNDHIMFVVDYATYRYHNVDDFEMPSHLMFRLKNLYLKA